MTECRSVTVTLYLRIFKNTLLPEEGFNSNKIYTTLLKYYTLLILLQKHDFKVLSCEKLNFNCFFASGFEK